MRSPRVRANVVLALALGLAVVPALTSDRNGGAHAETEAPPYIAIRDLQRLQDRIAAGDSVAAAAHAKAIAHTAVAFASVKSSVWSDVRNARAVVLYLFSGGNASAIAEAIPPATVSKETQLLYEGALAYGLGQDEKARDRLLPIDARALPSGLGGHLALVQATLMASSDKAKAIERLDLARLLEPGTLVEEAALRKELMLIDVGDRDLAKFTLLSRRYVGSFPRSVYFTNFRQLLAQAAMAAGATDDPAQGARLQQIVEVLDPPDRCHLLLAIAHDALVLGRMKMAAFTSEEAGRLARHGDPDEARAMVYFGASTIAGSRYELGRKALVAAPVARLDDNDQALRTSAIAVSDMIRDPAFAGGQPAQRNRDTLVVQDGDKAIEASEAVLKLLDK